MFLKEIPMIYLDKKDLQKSRKDPSLKEAIIDPICLFLYLNFMKADLWFSHLEEDRSVRPVKALEIKEESFINVKLAKVQEK